MVIILSFFGCAVYKQQSLYFFLQNNHSLQINYHWFSSLTSQQPSTCSVTRLSCPPWHVLQLTAKKCESFAFYHMTGIREVIHTSIGVPQGSLLCALIFSVYAQSLSEVSVSLGFSYHCYTNATQHILSFPLIFSSYLSMFGRHLRLDSISSTDIKFQQDWAAVYAA